MSKSVPRFRKPNRPASQLRSLHPCFIFWRFPLQNSARKLTRDISWLSSVCKRIPAIGLGKHPFTSIRIHCSLIIYYLIRCRNWIYWTKNRLKRFMVSWRVAQEMKAHIKWISFGRPFCLVLGLYKLKGASDIVLWLGERNLILLCGWIFRIESAVRFWITSFLTAVSIQWWDCGESIIKSVHAGFIEAPDGNYDRIETTLRSTNVLHYLTLSLMVNCFKNSQQENVFPSLPFSAHATYSL
jgi:hypothetical protein